MKFAFLAILTLISTTALAQSYIDDFWQDDQTIKYISDNMYVTQGLDMAEFSENFAVTTRELRQSYINEAISLMKAGAGGGQALRMVLTFDDRVYDRRQVAKKGMGKTIAANFRAGLESIYDNFENEGGQRKMEIISSDNASYIPYLTWGVRPGAGVYALLKIVNADTGISRTFSAKSKVEKIHYLGQSLAMLAFNSLHKTRFPLVKTLSNKKLLISGVRTLKTATYTQYRNMLKMVDDRCKAQNKRMATTSEMRNLFTGFYFGGISRGQSHWAAKNYSYQYMLINYDYPLGTSQGLTNSPFNRSMKYICVEEIKPNFRY